MLGRRPWAGWNRGRSDGAASDQRRNVVSEPMFSTRSRRGITLDEVSLSASQRSAPRRALTGLQREKQRASARRHCLSANARAPARERSFADSERSRVERSFTGSTRSNVRCERAPSCVRVTYFPSRRLRADTVRWKRTLGSPRSGRRDPARPPSPTCARLPRVGPSTSLGPVTRSRPARGPRAPADVAPPTPSLAPVARVVGRRRRRAGAWANTSP